MKKKITLSIFMGVMCFKIFAQPAIKTQLLLRGDKGDFFTCMTSTNDGGQLVGGSSYSNISFEKTGANRGVFSTDYWIIKLDKKGKIQWDKTIGGSGQEDLTCMQQTKDGGFILGGTSGSNISGEKTQNGRGLNDYWVVKIDASGNIQWDKTIGGSLIDELRSIQQTKDGGYIIGGTSHSNISGEKTENNRGGGGDIDVDYWIVKLDNSGNIEWDKTIGGNREDYLTVVAQTKDGGYIVGGTSSSDISGDKTEVNKDIYLHTPDYWIVKLNSDGNIQWDKTIGGTGSDVLTSMLINPDGSYILSGYSYSGASGDKTGTSRGSDDYWIVKLDKNKNILWETTIGGQNTDEPFSIQPTLDKGYIIGGVSWSSASAEKSENQRGYSDYWVVKIDSLGTFKWDKTIGGNKKDECYAINEIRKDIFIVAGSSYSGVSGDKLQKAQGDIDYWLVQLKYTPASKDVESAISEDFVNNNVQSKKAFHFNSYPNPAKDIIHIQNTGKATFVLTNQSGKVLITKIINGNGEINVAHLPAGLYYLKNNETGVVQKVMITK